MTEVRLAATPIPKESKLIEAEEATTPAGIRSEGRRAGLKALANDEGSHAGKDSKADVDGDATGDAARGVAHNIRGNLHQDFRCRKGRAKSRPRRPRDVYNTYADRKREHIETHRRSDAQDLCPRG